MFHSLKLLTVIAGVTAIAAVAAVAAPAGAAPKAPNSAAPQRPQAAAVSAPASASDASDLTYGLRNGSNSLCLQPINATQDAGAEVVQWPCNGRAEQRWVFRLAPVDCSRPLNPFCWRPTRYQIENELSMRCLDALGGATNGTRVVQWPCGSLSNQTWDTGVTLTGSPTVVTAMRSGVSGTFSHCLDVSGGQLSTVGLPMQIWGCNGTIAQKWYP